MSNPPTSPTEQAARKRTIYIVGLIIFLLFFAEPLLYRTGLAYYLPFAWYTLVWIIIIIFVLRKLSGKTARKKLTKKSPVSKHFQTSTPSIGIQQSSDGIRKVILIIVLIIGAITLAGYFLANNLNL